MRCGTELALKALKEGNSGSLNKGGEFRNVEVLMGLELGVGSVTESEHSLTR